MSLTDNNVKKLSITDNNVIMQELFVKFYSVLNTTDKDLYNYFVHDTLKDYDLDLDIQNIRGLRWIKYAR